MSDSTRNPYYTQQYNHQQQSNLNPHSYASASAPPFSPNYPPPDNNNTYSNTYNNNYNPINDQIPNLPPSAPSNYTPAITHPHPQTQNSSYSNASYAPFTPPNEPQLPYHTQPATAQQQPAASFYASSYDSAGLSSYGHNPVTGQSQYESVPSYGQNSVTGPTPGVGLAHSLSLPGPGLNVQSPYELAGLLSYGQNPVGQNQSSSVGLKHSLSVSGAGTNGQMPSYGGNTNVGSYSAAGSYPHVGGGGGYEHFEQRGSFYDESLSGSYGGSGGYGGGVGGYERRGSEDLTTKLKNMGMDDGVYAYQGGKSEPYGARGTSGKSSMWGSSGAGGGAGSRGEMTFDDYGRRVNVGGGNEKMSGSSNKVVRAVPKMDTQEDVKSGVQKFKVKLLAETGGQNMDILCQIGLDGIRMLDPNTGRTLRIYPLDTVTRSEVLDSSIFAFWSKTPVDFEPRRIRLKSSSYTTNTLLDTVTAATFQLKEMGGKDTFRSKSYNSGKIAEQPLEKKKSITEWVSKIKPPNEEKDHWVPDEAVAKCTSCGSDFGAFLRRHHCRNCGDIFCDKCTQGRIALTADENAQPVRVCDRCMAEVTQRLNNFKESASKTAVSHSHEDLARKLQEEMDRNRKASSGSKSSSNGSGKRMKEVACPTCTVHLQVQVPTSGSETIECGVCQHPFLVSAH